MKCAVVTIFPEMFAAVTEFGITAKAIRQGLVQISFFNPRDYADDRYKTVDDRPYGGGIGMVMKVEPLKKAIMAAKQQLGDAVVIYLSPQGKKVEQKDIDGIAARNVIFVCGRYEGIDERLFTLIRGEEWSFGDFVLSGGELAAMTFIDAAIRKVEGVLSVDAVTSDSFATELLDYPTFTRPESVDGMQVPDVLLSGDHAKIARWRYMQQVMKTRQKRPDLFAKTKIKCEDGQKS